MRFVTLLLASLPLSASVVYDFSDLLTPTTADQLGVWLGEGDLQLTRIYAANAPADWSAFHAAADGQGRTFTVMQALVCDSSFNERCILTDAIIGGYNPQSWHSVGAYNLTPLDDDRTAFLFNLTESRIHRQILGNSDGNAGQFQTYNDPAYGPTFGGGHDLWPGISGFDSNAYNYSYGPGQFSGVSIAGANSSTLGLYYSFFTLGKLEVFTIENTVVPEPATAVLVGGAFACLLLLRRFRMRG